MKSGSQCASDRQVVGGLRNIHGFPFSPLQCLTWHYPHTRNSKWQLINYLKNNFFSTKYVKCSWPSFLLAHQGNGLPWPVRRSEPYVTLRNETQASEIWSPDAHCFFSLYFMPLFQNSVLLAMLLTILNLGSVLMGCFWPARAVPGLNKAERNHKKMLTLCIYEYQRFLCYSESKAEFLR